MVVDALLAADAYLKISEQIDDPHRYVLLTDSILEEIERSVNPVSDTFPIICATQHFDAGTRGISENHESIAKAPVIQVCRYRPHTRAGGI
jgi:hypothetical protein